MADFERPMLKVFIHRRSRLRRGQMRAGEAIVVCCGFNEDPFEVARARLVEIGVWSSDMILSRHEWWK